MMEPIITRKISALKSKARSHLSSHKQKTNSERELVPIQQWCQLTADGDVNSDKVNWWPTSSRSSLQRLQSSCTFLIKHRAGRAIVAYWIEYDDSASICILRLRGHYKRTRLYKNSTQIMFQCVKKFFTFEYNYVAYFSFMKHWIR